MTDPYKVLGVSPTADDKEIKAAYKKLVRKYHPDKYQDEDMARLANEKMTEINAAYDMIMDERKNGGSSSYSSYSQSSSYGNSYSNSYGGYGQSTNYVNIRNMIHAGRISEAESLLQAVPVQSRNAEWYFLQGTIYYKKGWLNAAYDNIKRASQMDPTNYEYSKACQDIGRQLSGYMNGSNRYSNSSNNQYDVCNCLSDLCLADCCCEMMGGDLIPCC